MNHFVDFLVEIDQKARFLFVERTEEIRVVIEIGCAFVGTHKSNPMLVLPTLLVTNLHIARELFAIHTLHGYGEREAIGNWRLAIGLRVVRHSNRTAIAVGLLRKTLHHLNLHCRWIRQKLAVPFHGTQICCW